MTDDRSHLVRASSAVKTPCQLLRIRSSGEIVQLKNYSIITQLYDVESAEGNMFSVQTNQVSHQVNQEDAQDFMRRHEKK